MNQRTDQPQSSPPTDDIDNEPSAGASFPVVGVGASAGGLEAFTQLLKALPVDTGMAFVLVQHLAPSHPSALAEILSRATSMPVTEVHDEPTVEPNHVYVIPPACSMIIVQGALKLLPREDHGLRRGIDQFFRALAEDSRERAIGVVLSGTATDGTLGLGAIKAEGGITFAQDDSAQHDGMPRSAIASGCVDFVLPPDEIAREIVLIGQLARASLQLDNRPDLAQVVQVLHHVTGVDFTHYKFNTVNRRVTRRMARHKMDKVPDYVNLLRHDHAEADALLRDMLVSVSSFFRNPEAYEALYSQVFPLLIKDRSPDDPVRLWTLGCSTGQEAYSLAMAFTEFCEAAGSTVPLQLFASDLNAAAIEKARAGVYPKDIEQDVSPQRLRRFFTEVDGGYRIAKSIRDICVFSRHNVLSDPPFSHIDLLSCRNLLIYLEPILQNKVMPMLHYALKPSGFLWLGGSETIGSHRNLFAAVDAKHKIYARKSGSSPGHGHFPLQHEATRRPTPYTAVAAWPAQITADDLPKEADRILSTRFAPPGVLVSVDLEILQYRGDTSAYLAPGPGKASLNLLKMLREGLLVGVRAAILHASKEAAPVREDGLRVKSNDGYRDVSIEVIPVNKGGSAAKQGGFLILFEEPCAASRVATDAVTREAADTAVSPDTARLTQELAATREYLQLVIEQQDAANEELQSANEEVQSANEELQSTNEELETSREEIQSRNEELATVNDVLNNRNAELNRLNNDLANLLGSVQMPIVILGPDLRVRRFTPAAEKLFNLTSSDVGRSLAEIKLNLDDLPDLAPLLTEVIHRADAREHEVRDARGRQYSLRLRPYRTLDNKIDGVVVMLVDVDVIKRAHALADSILATAREPLLVLDSDLRVRNASPAFYETFGVTPKDTENHSLYELGNDQWDIPELRRLLEDVLPRDNQISDYTVSHEFEDIGLRTMKLNARRLIQADDQPPLILLAIEDVTQSEIAQKALQQSEQRFRVLFDSGPFAVYSCDVSGVIQEFNRRAAGLWGRAPARGDTDERFCGSFKMHMPDGTFMPHDQCPMAEVLNGKIPVARDMEVIIERPDGSRVTVLVNIVPLTNERGEITGAINCFYDITERKHAEELLRVYAAEMSESGRRKNEFLAMLGHELRNPLAPISNAMHILRLTDGDEQTARSALSMMERQVGLLVRMVDDLLDVGRISAGKIELRKTRVELSATATHAMEDFRASHENMERELTIALPSRPLYVSADASRLSQVLINLLSNACKFTDPGGRIALSVEKAGKHALIRVRDNGIGISPNQLERIFTMFVQIDTSMERPVSGLGIGLALAKNLVELHEGTLEAHSAGLDRGSEFVVRLPTVAASVESPGEAPVSAAVAVTGRRILIVDDNVNSATSLATLLDLTGYHTCTANDGLEAVKAAAAFRPDVVLMDIGLPKLNGYEAARQIREQPWGKNIVLMALTGWGQDEDRQKSKDAGFDGHMVKPVDYAALTKLLASLPPG